ncbi:TetR/AcrR family transcriptional regulator [Microbispora amethystogenes]|uniref:TetR family transcriptional regulator n=2 Tax=Microbispora amethystogenes TaxID=1427754 RepID=A0ABQ4FPX3_9ACTN|nr:TetR/AcrR family transcriptional regulator [Microbispora amethystogenes]GIH36866.1 TetR family transcriptional regulator [Microbispora amethystogenes]
MAIHAAVERLSLAKGFDSITVSDITALADVHRSTFYRHYRDKFHLVETCYENGTRKGREILLSAAGPVASQQFITAFAQVLDHIAAHRNLYSALLIHKKSLWFESWLHEHWIGLINDVYRRSPPPAAQMSDEALSDLRTGIAAHASVATLRWWVREKQWLTSEQLARWYTRHALPDISRHFPPGWPGVL